MKTIILRTIAMLMGIAVLFAVSGCEDSDDSADERDYLPRPGDEELTKGPVYINSADLLMLKTYPPKYNVLIKGALPTPCHSWRAVVNPPNEAQKIDVDVYSLVDPNVVCIQVLVNFEGSVEIPNPPPGRYEVRVNGKSAGFIE
ncbi:MAG: hypothetical protein NZ740_01630 [Kiritimatiellae bacterium]|nr:hypothetical protein [Kiritimatiellia bacterium]MDW8457792.1 hypothetical protein [Verrucomicrobiota bacterium]